MAPHVEPTSSFIAALPVIDGAPHLSLGRVRLERKLKEGLLSESWLGQHLGLNVPVTLRVMKPAIRQQLGTKTFDDITIACQNYARIRHPNITAMYDTGMFEEHPFAVIEYVSGIPLQDRVKERRLSEAEALKLFTPIADGLAAMWRNDVLHRGVSPYRIFVDSDGQPKLDCVILPRAALDPLLTDAHAPFMAGFWSPEELRGSLEIDLRSDVFSFGASMYYALTGQSPFGIGSQTNLIARTLSEPPIDPRTLVPQLSADMHNFLMKCLERDARNRYANAGEFLRAFGQLKMNMTSAIVACDSSLCTCLQPDELPPASEFRQGTKISQYDLGDKLGAGAFGIVYKARHQLLDMHVAVKLLPSDLAQMNPEYVKLFLREARTAMRIRHKHVIGLFEAGEDNGQYYLVMELAPNGSVADRIRLFPDGMPEEEIFKVLRESALGLSAAEEIGIVHRDIKPANLMYGAQNEIKIADLGLAKRVWRPDLSPSITESMRAEQLTMVRGDNALQGTPAYMAPEMVVAPKDVDTRADLYSLGVSAYQMATGKLPFEATSMLQAMMKHVTEPVPPPSRVRRGLSKELDSLIVKLMSKIPSDRFFSAKDMAQALS